VIGFAQIIGGKPSSVGGMTDHLMNKTLALGSDDERLALYYGRGQISDSLQELARAVADGSLRFSEAVEAAMSEHIGAGVISTPSMRRRTGWPSAWPIWLCASRRDWRMRPSP
jgi:hypothetical protein